MEKSFPEQNFLPSTKDVLGGHLHQKVSQILSENLIDDKTFAFSGCSLADKVTGMLLERSLKDIHKMLQVDMLLLKNIKLVIMVLQKECPQLPEMLVVNKIEGRQMLSMQEIGEVLYERICRIEEPMAPQITGMLLELDAHLLHKLINESSLLEVAVGKAKEVLLSVHPSSLSSSKCEYENRDDVGGWKAELEQKAGKEIVGQLLYDEIQKVHPECASHLTDEAFFQFTGMILELDLSDLKLFFGNKTQLQAAISRAYKEWIKSCDVTF